MLKFLLIAALERRIEELYYRAEQDELGRISDQMERITLEEPSTPDRTVVEEKQEEQPNDIISFSAIVVEESVVGLDTAVVEEGIAAVVEVQPEDYQTNCPICLNEFDEGQHRPDCGENCGHLTCEMCMVEAIEVYRQRNCPICRVSLFNEELQNPRLGGAVVGGAGRRPRGRPRRINPRCS